MNILTNQTIKNRKVKEKKNKFKRTTMIKFKL